MINKTSSIRLRFFFCALFLFIHLYTRGQNSKIVQGKIIERTTGQAISYASIKLIKASQSTISNVEGIFVFSYSIPLPGDSLTISAVGYSTVKIAISDFISKNRTIIALEENVTILNTVAVTPLRAEVILKAAVKNSNMNYIAPSVLNGYYKEYVKRDSLLIKYADGIVSYFIQKQKNGTPNVLLQVLQSRVKEIEIPDEEDKVNQLNTQINIKGIGEFANPSRPTILDSANFKYYKYRVLETEEKGKVVYIVNFSPIAGDKKALYTGKIYIDKESMLILGLDYTVAPISIGYLADINILGIHIGVTSRQLSLRYKIEHKNYHLAYVGQQYGIKIRSKRFNQNNSFKSEFWVSKVETDNIFTFKENYNKRFLYKRGNNYQTEFWKEYSAMENTDEEITFLSEK